MNDHTPVMTEQVQQEEVGRTKWPKGGQPAQAGTEAGVQLVRVVWRVVDATCERASTSMTSSAIALLLRCALCTVFAVAMKYVQQKSTESREWNECRHGRRRQPVTVQTSEGCC